MVAHERAVTVAVIAFLYVQRCVVEVYRYHFTVSY